MINRSITRRTHTVLLAVLLLGASLGTVAQPIGSAFTYQGRLRVAAIPAEGYYDFTFTLFDEASGGSQVSGPVSRPAVDVIGGVFAVQLDFGAEAFDGTARWLEIEVSPASRNQFTTLSPRQELKAAPYALYAVHAAGVEGAEIPYALSSAGGRLQDVVTVDQTGAVWVGGEVAYAPEVQDQENTTETQLLGPGNWVQSFTAGRSGRLNRLSLRVRNYSPSSVGYATAYVYEGPDGSGRLLGSTLAIVNPNYGGLQQFSFSGAASSIALVAGRVYSWRLTGVGASCGDGNPYPRGRADHDSDVDFWFQTWVTAPQSFSPGGLYVSPTGHVGVGTQSPGNYDLRVNGYSYLGGKVRLGNVVGNLRIVDSSTEETLIELGSGLDYAEGFDTTEDRAITAGSVLSIDPENAGQLRLSTKAYDRKVAGIVAGANGLGSAICLGAGKFDCDVALAGRVYCNVDAKDAGVEPGDLLTTSSVAGYAMKVNDHHLAQGAILGKAMERLAQGTQGQILVLVTLQ